MDREEGLGLGRVGGEAKTIKICCVQFQRINLFFNQKIKQKKQPKDKGGRVQLIKGDLAEEQSSLFIKFNGGQEDGAEGEKPLPQV